LTQTTRSSHSEVAGDEKQQERSAEREPCDYCGALALEWRKCKLVCGNCHQINKSCADL
jgi:hypothetical protein